MWHKWWQRFQTWLQVPLPPEPCPPHKWAWAVDPRGHGELGAYGGYHCEKCGMWADKRVAFTNWKTMWGAK